ncbi:MAG: Mu transposase C-terminal domain-containing protein [Verrucomicrobiales bacterium]|nr:Mu transposase C-terminal domain-containing protein [Verrucomicrobiales bacterium]
MRRVKSGQGNVSGSFVSHKMGFSIDFESHTLELPYIHMLEHDPAVVEYYGQPSQIPLNYQRIGGKRISFYSTPDFFVLRQNCAGWVEIKPDSRLAAMHEKDPARISRNSSGHWICPPANEYAARYGLGFELVTEAQIDTKLANNYELLSPYFSWQNPDPALPRKAESLLREYPGLSAAELREALDCPIDDVWGLIAKRLIYCDLSKYRLATPHKAPVYASERQAKFVKSSVEIPSYAGIQLVEGNTFLWNNIRHTILHINNQHVAIQSDAGSVTELSEAELVKLIRKGSLLPAPESMTQDRPANVAAGLFSQLSNQELQEIIMKQKMLAGEIEANYSSRTLQRYRAKIRQARLSGKPEIAGLAHSKRQRGNRNPKLPALVREEMAKFIEQHYKTNKAINVAATYQLFRNHCKGLNLIPPSEPTFYKAIKALPRYEVARARTGHRGAYESKEFYYYLSDECRRHGGWPFHYCHIDHTEADVELVDKETGLNLGRPWLSLLIDSFSRRVLAFVLIFDPPSYRTCMLLLRTCVERYSRFPQYVIIDGGKEFESIYFDSLLGLFHCHKKTRPPAEARFGAVLERHFGASNTRFFHNLAGNTKLTRTPRAVTKNFDPKRLAVWTLEDLHACLEKYLYEIYDQIPHPSLLQSPQSAFNAGIRNTGSGAPQLLPYDEGFKILTLPAARRGTCKIHPNKGIQLNYVNYWNELFRRSDLDGAKVEVRFDPYDISTVYAFVDKRWVKCSAWNSFITKGTTEKELELISTLFRKKRPLHNRNRHLHLEKYAEFLKDVTDQELHLQQRRDLALKSILQPGESGQKTNPSPTKSSAKPKQKASIAEEINLDNLTPLEPL